MHLQEKLLESQEAQPEYKRLFSLSCAFFSLLKGDLSPRIFAGKQIEGLEGDTGEKCREQRVNSTHWP